jgi:hypothetical protein
MLLLAEFGSLLTLGLMVYCLVDIIMCPEPQPHGLPKLIWVLMVMFLVPPVGPLVWVIVSRRAKATAGPPPGGPERRLPDLPEYDRPGRAAAPDPETDAEFLRRVRERAEEQRRRYRESKEQAGVDPAADRPAPEPPSDPAADPAGPEGDRPA